MSENPYESPKAPPAAVVAESRLRKQARLAFRLSALVLFLPAIYNYCVLVSRDVAPLPDYLANFARTVSIAAFAVAALLISFLGFPALELIARLLRIVFARGADRNAWDEILYRSLNRTIYLAVPGAVLWAIWVVGFYELRWSYHAIVISWAVGVPAHLLAACWYVPLIYQWFRLALSGPARATPQN